MANNDNIIYARFNHGHEITTDPRSQYAYGQVVKINGLHLPANFDADIANKGDKQAKAIIGTNNELPIDDNYFLSGKDVIVMINVHAADKDGRTKYIIRIPVEKRPERADIELEPVEQDVVSTAIATLNEAVEQTSADAESAENNASRAHESAMSAEQSATNASNSETLVKQYTERAETAAESSEKSETNAKASEESAKQSESHAEQIANDIEQFTERAETASRNAESSATTATEKAGEISESAYIATTKADEASNAATYAQQAATYAGEFANSASASANKAELNAQKTQSDKEVVELAKSDVMSAVDSAQNYAESAQSANQAIQDMNVQAVTLNVGSDVTVEKTVDPATGAVTLTYGIPKGIKGDKGDTGSKGDPFVYSDFTPEQLASLKGEKGDKGDQGIQGIQGERGEKGDTGAKGDKGDAFTYSDFTPEQLASLKGEKGDKGDKGEKGDTGAQGIQGEKGDTGDDYVLTQADKEEIAGLVDTPVDDVRINGQSIVESGVANIPYGSNDNYGLLKASSTNGIFASGGVLSISNASESDIKGGTEELKPLTPNREHMATFYGLAKASGDSTQSASSNPVGTYTDEAKASIKNMLGVEDVDIDSKAPVITETISGDVVSFTDGADDIPLKSCIVQVEPVQEGSGDPSPDNIRPITGWTGCEVVQTNENLLLADDPLEPNANYFNGTKGTSNNTIVYSDTEKAYTTKYTIGEQVSSGVSYSNHAKINATHESKTRLFVAPKTATYTFYVEYKNVDSVYGIRFYTVSVDGTRTRKKDIVGAKDSVWKSDTVTVNLAKGEGIYLIFYNDIYWRNMMIVEGDATEFIKSIRQTYPITFPSSAGTVYGAYVDVINGELVVDRAQIASYNGETLPSTWISDRDVYSAGTTPTIGAQVVYKLAEPIHYHLTPQEITSLLGVNNVWADTGDIEVEYRASTKMYIDRKITEAVAAALNS